MHGNKQIQNEGKHVIISRQLGFKEILNEYTGKGLEVKVNAAYALTKKLYI